MWASVFDAEDGFWGEFGPTTVARRETCFNHSQDLEECNWAGPSWPYETSRVITGLSNFLAEYLLRIIYMRYLYVEFVCEYLCMYRIYVIRNRYPASQVAAAGMDAAHYTRLLKTYAFSHTHGNATNGSVPWVGEVCPAYTHAICTNFSHH